MHELSVATGIVNRALAAARDHGGETVEELTVEVGKATHVNPDQLEFCLEAGIEGTIAAGATITIETIQPEARCGCGWRGRPDRLDAALSYAPDMRCPECGERATLERGRECRLASVEIPDHGGEPTAEPGGRT